MVLAGCSAEGRSKKPALPDLSSKPSAIHHVPVPRQAVLDRAASTKGKQVYRLEVNTLYPSDLEGFYDRTMPRGKPFDGLAWCGAERALVVGTGSELSWRRPGSDDFVVVRYTTSPDLDGEIVVTDDRKNPSRRCSG